MSHIECNSEKCVGCLACVTACIDQHCENPHQRALSARIILRRTDGGAGYTTTSCQHCTSAPGAEACPTGALSMQDDMVQVEREKCVGCRTCARVCPFSVPRFDAGGIIVKCDLCTHGPAGAFPPSCVNICPAGALRIV